MTWSVRTHDAFDPEFDALEDAVKEALLAHIPLLMRYGPSLGRPYVDTLAGSGFANMKELRFGAGNGVWRVAFAFDPARQAILLVAGDKAGMAQRRFYTALIDKADKRFAEHLRALEKGD